jgi:tripeptidyl-peptidase-1
MLLRSVALFFAFSSLAVASVHHRGSLPAGWTQSDVLELSAKPLSITLALTENPKGVAQLKKIALEVSDPSSAKYGQHLSPEQIQKLVAPSTEAVQRVSDWLNQAMIPAESFTLSGSTISLDLSVAQAESLFGTQIGKLVNLKTNQTALRAADYWIPDHLDSHIAAVFGLHGLPLPHSAAPPSTPAKVTPAVLNKFYSVSGVSPKADTKNSQAVAEFQGQYMNNSDLTAFFKEFITDYSAGTDDKVSKFVGDTDKQAGQTEASLDIQYIKSVAPALKTEFWLFNSMDFCGDLANWTSLILSTKGAPQVHSVSYGWQGDLKELQCADSKIKVVDDNFAKLAAAGFSIIISSGDSGSGYKPASDADGHKHKYKLWPSWPASSGWVTAVGATRFVDQKIGNAEMATDQFGSGGGFSDMFSIATDAKWQQADVQNYFKIAPQLPKKGFSKTGRGTPDVSALGEGYQVLQNGRIMSVGGTSASAPVFAGMIGMINEARIQAGKPPMGCLNPWIYQNADAFTDVVLGNNAIGRGEFTTPAGFNCTKGWDPVTGVGTPIFNKMLAAAMK